MPLPAEPTADTAVVLSNGDGGTQRLAVAVHGSIGRIDSGTGGVAAAPAVAGKGSFLHRSLCGESSGDSCTRRILARRVFPPLPPP